MKPTILIADDVGACFKELGTAFEGRNVGLERAVSLEECVEKCRASQPAIIIVYAGMSRAFSLLRIVRRSEDIGKIPLIVCGEPEQEELIAKHRKLPSRADRYLLRPIDVELVRSVTAEFLTGDDVRDISFDEKTPPPLPGQRARNAVAEAPDAYSRVQAELKNYQGRVKELEQDLQALSKVSKENASLREELTIARARDALQPAGSSADGDVEGADHNELFVRLEEGYKATIEDMERLVQEKDEIISRLATSEGGDGENTPAVAKELEREQERFSDVSKSLRGTVKLLDELAIAEAEVGLEDLLGRLASMADEAEHLAASFGFDEETVVVDAESIALGLNDP
jgi:response regulator RpfG family c-di-GMP phosphodiesterase